MKNIALGAVLGVVASILVHFFMTPDPDTAPLLKRSLSPVHSNSALNAPASTSNSQSLSEQQLRRIIQEEIRANVSEQLTVLRQELAQAVVNEIEAEKRSNRSEKASVANRSEAGADNNPMYQTVSNMVDAARIDGYFTPESIAELKTHYAQLDDAQKFQIDAKLADAINNGTLEFDEALFLPVH